MDMYIKDQLESIENSISVFLLISYGDVLSGEQ